MQSLNKRNKTNKRLTKNSPLWVSKCNRLCKICNKEFLVKKPSSPVLHCSYACGKITQIEKASKSLKEYYRLNPDKVKRGPAHSSYIGEAVRRKRRGKGIRAGKHSSIWEFSSRTVSKILRRLGLGCSVCGWNEASCDIHHIEGKKIPECHKHSNLSLLCPNCHRLVHAGKIEKSSLKSLEETLPNNWKDYYYG